MPTVFRRQGFRFFFYSNEGSPLEPIHVHVEKAGDQILASSDDLAGL
ncbi:DUF4160 domain-containing protein [Sphingosinicella terrae]|nr:DUF4160 domain-containing protein [Sphingosinicella terrae]